MYNIKRNRWITYMIEIIIIVIIMIETLFKYDNIQDLNLKFKNRSKTLDIS